MATIVIMPKQGQSVESCIITKWFIRKGEKVETGDIILSYETDKAAFDLEAPAAGILLDTYFEEGAEVPVLSEIALIGAPGEKTEINKTVQTKIDKAEATVNITEQNIVQAAAPDSFNDVTGARIRISPRAKKYAARHGIDFTKLRGSGPNGRIICADVENQPLSEAKQDSEYTDQPVSNVRKIIANAMQASLQNSAQLTHHMSADVRKLLSARKKIKDAARQGGQDITLNDMICWCVIRALERHPAINSHYLGDKIRQFNTVNLGLAVDTSRGLIVPALRDAGHMSIQQLSSGLKSLADACRKGNVDTEIIKPSSASFTVSNLGNYGVEMFTPVINLPQTGILGVCTIINRPADLGNSTFGFVPYIGLSLTYDHRAVDGGPATLFLKEIKEQIENFNF